MSRSPAGASKELDTASIFAAPSVAACQKELPRRALRFQKSADARMYFISLLRNGTDALICPDKAGGAACVCEVRSLAPEEVIAWMNESPPSHDSTPAE